MTWWQILLSALAALSMLLLLWQWLAALRFPLHRRIASPSFFPAVTIFKPLKGADSETETCLRSWLAQDYRGPVQFLFGAASENDPACDIARKLIREFPERDAKLIIGPQSNCPNAKVGTLINLSTHACHDFWIISDADVYVPPDFLSNVIAPFQQPDIALVNCFYQLANPSTLAMRCEAVAVNADFWSQVLQARCLKPLDFALGAVMAARRSAIESIGGFQSLCDYLADDFQLGHQIATRGGRIELCPVVVECRESPQGWRQIWKHQLRWARTIRVCRPLPYFFSILSNATLWPLAAAIAVGNPAFWGALCFCVALRCCAALNLQSRLTCSRAHLWYDFLVPLKDMLHALLWALAFAGNTIEWRGTKYTLTRDGRLIPKS